MRGPGGRDVYGELGLKRVVNAMGNVTVLGGSMLADSVQAAVAEANESFVDMEDLLEKSGAAIAGMLGAQAALVTSGCYAGLVLGAAAIMTGKDPQRIARLPDSTGMKNGFLVQRRMRYHYDRAVTVPGGRLVEVGDQQGTTAAQLAASIDRDTAGILYVAKLEGMDGVLSLPEVVDIAREKHVAVLVDAAAEIYPLERMTWLAGGSGADLVCFGAKYFGSVNSAGIVCGRRAMVDAAALNGFIAYEVLDNHALGRGYKVDRQEVIATLVALREWFAMDHRQRFAVQERRLTTIAEALAPLAYVRTERVWPRRGAWMQLRVTFDEARVGKSPAAICAALKSGDPSVRVRLEEGQVQIAVQSLLEGEDGIVAESLRKVLANGGVRQ